MTPSSLGPGKTAWGASGTPTFASTSSSAATSSSSTHSLVAAPSGRSAAQSSPLRHPPAVPQRRACATA
eukprot:5816266-Pleurochrysis_carterae.AAC.2